MTTGHQRREHIVDHAVLADDGFLQFDAYCLSQLAGALPLLRGMAGCIGTDRFTHDDSCLAIA
ncbi:hypothetical protein D3C85_1824840 [compost metagenome]